MKHAKIKKLTSTALVALLMSTGLAAGFAAPAAALDGTSGSGGNSGSSGGTNIAKKWLVIKETYKNNNNQTKANVKETAWSQFTKAGEGNTEYNVKMAKAELDKCKSAQQIWYIANDKNGFVWNGQQNKNVFKSTGLLTITTAKSLSGSKVSKAEFEKWSGAGNTKDDAAKLSKKQVSIICWYDDKYLEPETRYKWYFKVDPASEPKEFTGVTHKAVEITRQGIHNANSVINGDPIGVNNLEHQPRVTVETNFGKLAKKLIDDSKKADNKRVYTDVKQVTQLVKEAQEKDKALSLTANLSSKNQDGLAEGGVLNVSEYDTKVTLNLSPPGVQTEMRLCMEKTIQDNYKVRWPRAGENKKYVINGKEVWWDSCSPWQEINEKALKDFPEELKKVKKLEDKYVSSTETELTDSSVTLTSFYQMLSVHCNPKDFEKLMANVTDASKVDISTNGDTISAFVISKRYSSVPAIVDFGGLHVTTANWTHLKKVVKDHPDIFGKVNSDKSSSLKNGEIIGLMNENNFVKLAEKKTSKPSLKYPTTAQKTQIRKTRSAFLSFYDKECGFQCIAENTGKGATTSNDAVNNKGNIGDNTENWNSVGRYGAQTEKVSGDQFTLFRDNAKRELRFDTWYPKNVDGVNYTGQPAVTTTITRWAEGTPYIIPTKEMGGKFEMSSGTKKLFTGDSAVKNQRNWDASTHSNSTSTILSGHHNKFIVKADWPSEANKPQKVAVKWEYAPNVSMANIPTTIGFTGTKAKLLSNKKTLTTAIQGKCNFETGRDTSVNTVNEFYSNTGSNTTNTLDVAIDNNSQSRNVVLNFIRSVSE